MIRLAITAVIVTSLVSISTASFAGNCGGHCQAGKMCGSMVKSKGTKKADWQSEYNKCMTNPDAYK